MSAGRVLARGRIRVDARRALAKLREHQLVDLHHYTQELARAAVASGASSLDVRCDADDVVVSWKGEPLATAALPRLLDHVLSEAVDRGSQRLRLLAVGVNAALGLQPAFVEVSAVDQQGARWVRWTPDMLREGGEEEEPREGELDRASDLEPGSVRVHLRRRVGWSVLRRAATGEVPREVVGLGVATEALELPLTLNGRTWARPETPAVLATTPLDIAADAGGGFGKMRRAQLELMAVGWSGPTMWFCEQGVVLARYVLDPSPHLPIEPHLGCVVPVRLLIDAEQLPTNASRSAVREDSELFRQVMAAAGRALTRLVDATLTRVLGRGETGDAVRFAPEASSLQLEDALGSLVCVAVGAWSRGSELSSLARALIDAPLLRDGCGGPRAYSELVAGTDQPLYLFEGDEPLEEELGLWMRDVIWVRGRVVERALEPLRTTAADDLVSHARAGLERKRQVMAHAPTRVAVPASPQHILREAFQIDEGPEAGLCGEVALRGTGPGGCTLRIFFEGRELAVSALSPALVPLPCDLAIAWDGRLQVRFGFDGVEDDQTLRRAVARTVEVALLAARGLIEQLAPVDGGRVKEPSESDETLRRLLRAAIGTSTTVEEGLGLATGTVGRIGASDPLWRAPVWPTTEPGRYLALGDIDRTVRSKGGHCVAAPGKRGRAADGRAVLALGPAERGFIEKCSSVDLAWVPYDAALLGPRKYRGWPERRDQLLLDVLEGQQSEHGSGATRFAVWFKRPGARGLVAVAPETTVVRMHAGQVLERATAARSYGPALMVVDEATALPSPGWDGIAWNGSVWSLVAVQRELLRALLAAQQGEPVDELVGELPSDPAAFCTSLRRYLVLSALALRDELAGDLDVAATEERELLLARVLAVPLVRMLDPEGVARWVSLEAVSTAHANSATVPRLDEVPGFETLAWYPLVVEAPALIAALDEWLAGRLTPAAAELDMRRRRAAEEVELRGLLASPALDPWELGDLAPADAPLGKHDEEGGTAVVAFGPRSAEGLVQADLLRERRAVGRLGIAGLPIDVVARVGLDDRHAYRGLRSLTDEGVGRATRMVAQAAVALVRSVLEVEPVEGTQSPLTEPRLVNALHTLCSHEGASSSQVTGLNLTGLNAVLRGKARWPTAQGGVATLKALRRERGQVLLARARYVPWLEGEVSSPLDEPVMFVPPGQLGEQLLAILRGLSVEVSDVSEVLAALQRRRTSGAVAPRLPGEPSDPLLRRAIEQPGLVGEMELSPGDRSVLTIHDLGGVPRDLPLQLPFALTAVVRSDTFDAGQDEATAHRVERLARQWVGGLPQWDDQPELGRGAFRALLLGPREEGQKVTAGERTAEVLADIRGGWHSIASLQQWVAEDKRKRVWVVTSAPPYPDRDYDRPIVRLTDGEMKGLRGLLPVLNATTTLRLDLEAAARRAAPQVDTLALPADIAPRCLRVRQLDADGLRGEVGLLHPEQIEHRGVHLHLTRRPLCRLDDEPGWPIVAMVDDETMKPNRFFDGPRTGMLGKELVARLRAIAGEMALELFAAPDTAAVEVAVDAGAPAGGGGGDEASAGDGLTALGRFWLPRRFPLTPTVRVWAPGLVGGKAKITLRRLGGGRGFEGFIPVEGDILAATVESGGDLHHALAELARAQGALLLQAAADEGALEAFELERYRWSFALLGVDLEPEPRAPTAAGDEVGPAEIRRELGQGDLIWHSAQAGTSDGQFPDEPPPFVLLDDGGPLLDVLRARAPGRLRELGGAESMAPVPPAARQPSEIVQQPPELPLVGDAEEATADGFLGGLRRWVVQAFAELPPPAPITRSLRETIGQRIVLLALTGHPVEEVAFARSGRAVRFQARRKRVVINRDHPAVLRLLPASEEPKPLALSLLVAAIVTEIDRAQEAVTPAEVLRVLTDLLTGG